MTMSCADKFFLYTIAAMGSFLAGMILYGSTSAGATAQKELFSKITSDTPISGFYGPGTWWAWLLTLGMSHAHTIMALSTKGELPSGWDYDLIGVSFYTIVAAIDLMRKSHAIAQLGDKASDSVLLPALACAERVVSIGTGSFFFMLTVSLFSDAINKARGSLFIIATSLVFSFVAAGFACHVHEVLWKTSPVFWCVWHTVSPPDQFNFTAVDTPAAWIWVISLGLLSTGMIAAQYWIIVGYCTAAVAALAFSIGLLFRRNFRRAWRWTAIAGGITLAVGVSMPFLILLTSGMMAAALWFYCWLFLWWPVYILAFFPQLGYFPLTSTSVFEMDQMAALLGVVLVAVIRILRRLYKAKYERLRVDSSRSSLELAPLLGGANETQP